MVVVSYTMGYKVWIVWVWYMLEYSSMIEDGELQIFMKIILASFLLEKFKDGGTDFEGKVMDWFKWVD